MQRKKLWLALSITLITVLILPSIAYTYSLNKLPKPDKQRPVPATNIEIVKKITLGRRGKPPTPPGQGKGKKKNGAATGILGEPYEGDSYAVVVGISDYPGEANDLNYSDDDAREMRDALIGVYGFSKSNVKLLTDLDATREAILTAIKDISIIAGVNDEIVFFFSGHGAKGFADDGDKERVDESIVVVSNDKESLTYIWDGEIKAAFSGFSTSRIIFIFDTCLSGGMKRDLEETGRVINMATNESGYAYESNLWENGEFSYYFVDMGMIQGKADIYDHDNDTTIPESSDVTIEEAFDYAKANCSYDKPTIGDYFEDDLLP